MTCPICTTSPVCTATRLCDRCRAESFRLAPDTLDLQRALDKATEALDAAIEDGVRGRELLRLRAARDAAYDTLNERHSQEGRAA